MMHRAAHITFLDTWYARGVFLASGPCYPRTGGIILARASTREALWEIMRTDPFYVEHIAEYRLHAWQANTFAPGVAEALNVAPPPVV
jgi:uncharacterized protein YciI